MGRARQYCSQARTIITQLTLESRAESDFCNMDGSNENFRVSQGFEYLRACRKVFLPCILDVSVHQQPIHQIPPRKTSVSEISSSSKSTRPLPAALDASWINYVVKEVTCSSHRGTTFLLLIGTMDSRRRMGLCKREISRLRAASPDEIGCISEFMYLEKYSSLAVKVMWQLSMPCLRVERSMLPAVLRTVCT
jgi:hypothetical protein